MQASTDPNTELDTMNEARAVKNKTHRHHHHGRKHRCAEVTSETQERGVKQNECQDDSSPERSSTLVSDSGAATSPDALTDDETDTNDHNSKEAEDPQKPKKAKTPKVNIFKMFKFAGPGELALIFVAILCSIGHGVLNPLMSVWIGDIIDKFGATTSPEEFTDAIAAISVKLCYCGIAVTVGSFLEYSLFSFTGQIQASKIRKAYFNSILRQEIGWHDEQETGQLSARIAGDIQKVQDALSDQIGTLIEYVSYCLTGFAIGFAYGWKMALVTISVAPLLIASGALLGVCIAKFTTAGQSAYAEAGGVAEECFSCIRTLTSFGGQQVAIKKFDNKLARAALNGMKRAQVIGAGLGTMFLFMLGSYSLAFWYGARLVNNGEMSAGDVMIVFMSVLMGASAIGQTSTPLSIIATGQGAAVHVFEVIARRSKIDPENTAGATLPSVEGIIEFQNVEFAYPTRPQAKVLRGLNLRIPKGKTVAIVGASGCGKSTVVSLLERFYSPSSGNILLDGVDISGLNLKWLRTQIGIVTQEPVLFATTIKENIAFGKEGAVSEKEIEQAAKLANAHNFIMSLPDRYETLVGERGAQLSGGQKQRVAIARALLRNPAILALDEATSALDNTSEQVVQEALEQASAGRTTIVIAHRLSTIRNANAIVVLAKGKIVEQGTHKELLQLRGHYYKLVRKQNHIQQVDTSSNDDVVVQEDSCDNSPNIFEDNIDMVEAGTRNNVSGPDVRWPFLRASKMSFYAEWPLLIIGGLAAAANGAAFPVFTIVLSGISNSLLFKTGEDLTHDAIMYAIYFVCVAVGTGLTGYIYVSFFATAGEKLTKKVRHLSFSSILRQDIEWFDRKENMSGTLSAQLATDATKVAEISGERIGTVLKIVATAVAGVVVAFAACWKIAFVVLATVPGVVIGTILQMYNTVALGEKFQKAYSESANILTDSISNIRTVASLSLEGPMMHKFFSAIIKPYHDGLRRCFFIGIGMGIAEGSLFGMYGSKLVSSNQTNYTNMTQAIMGLFFGALSLGHSVSQMPDYGKAIASAKQIFMLIDRKPTIDILNSSGEKIERVSGEIVFKNVVFSYPSRPHARVLNGLDLQVRPGQTVAIVGPSGCGKSTIISLVERFYNPSEGEICIDGRRISDLNLCWLRSQIGLVSQEPVLFATTIKENIAYGSPVPVSQEQIERAAEEANAHDFITALPDKYDTLVGEKGIQLSGGQKQRIAIARALIRDPKILLLDEATSALDAESETIIQSALDKATVGRTTIVIAHRLSTIQTADEIVVVNKGCIEERGTHAQLMARGGLYYKLAHYQRNNT